MSHSPSSTRPPVEAPGCPFTQAAGRLIDPRLHAEGDPRAVWRRLRSLDRLEWEADEEGGGFWSVANFAEADHVLRDHTLFTSEQGTWLDLLGKGDPAGGRQIAATDPPRHSGMRARLSKAMTARAVGSQRERITDLVAGLIAPLSDGGPFDFAQAMLVLPMAVSGVLLGVPEEDWPWLVGLSCACTAPEDPEFGRPEGKEATLSRAHRELFAYFTDLVRHRSQNLGDDLISILIQTEFEGRTMDLGEVIANCYSLLLGANVTTPHMPSFILAEYADTDFFREWSTDPALTATALEEGLRLASPVSHFMRYARQDTEVRGTPIKAGDAVVVWIGSANRDESVFAGSETFQIRRKPNKHLAFGAGPHYCVGHSVARLALKTLFGRLFADYTDIAVAGTPEKLRSNFVSGYKHLPITATRRPASTRSS